MKSDDQPGSLRDEANAVTHEIDGIAQSSGQSEPSVKRVVEPPFDQLHRLPTPLEPGERLVLDFFHRNLDPDWEIYIQPHLNGLCPDFVLLNPKVGIAVFEVKNWNFNAINYFPKKVVANRVDLWGASGGKEFSRETDNPFRKIALYKERIFNIYCPRLLQKAGFAAITGGVIFPSAERVQGLELQKAFLTESEQKTASIYLPAHSDAFGQPFRSHPATCSDVFGHL